MKKPVMEPTERPLPKGQRPDCCREHQLRTLGEISEDLKDLAWSLRDNDLRYVENGDFNWIYGNEEPGEGKKRLSDMQMGKWITGVSNALYDLKKLRDMKSKGKPCPMCVECGIPRGELFWVKTSIGRAGCRMVGDTKVICQVEFDK